MRLKLKKERAMSEAVAVTREDLPFVSSREPSLSLVGITKGRVNYLAPTEEKPAIHVDPDGRRGVRDDVRYEAHDIEVWDARHIADELSLDVNGFAFTRHETEVGDFYDDEEVRGVYYAEMEQLIEQATGAVEVVVFDHTVRMDGGEAQDARKPVRKVHGDYTPTSGPQRVRDLIAEDEADRWLKGRFAIINVWRPIAGPVQTAPLAFIDTTSTLPEDFRTVDLVYPDRRGEIFGVAHSPDHRWFYFPDMERNEAVLIKTYDSAEDGRARYSAHSAFDDPKSPPDAAPRESIEVRALVRFPSDPVEAKLRMLGIRI